MIDAFSDSEQNFSKNLLMIHFQNPDIISKASALSFAKLYPDWTFSFLTEDVKSWKTMFTENGFNNVNVIHCNEVEAEYRNQIRMPTRYATRADVLRTYYIFKYGGLYSDTDLIATRRMDDNVFEEAKNKASVLLVPEFYQPELGDNRIVGYTNAIFYSPLPKQVFMRYWVEAYWDNYSLWRGQRFMEEHLIGNIVLDGIDYYNELCVWFPYYLANSVMPSKVILLDNKSYFYPKDIFYYIQGGRKLQDYPQAYGFHLWRNIYTKLGVDYTLTEQWIIENPKELLSELISPYI